MNNIYDEWEELIYIGSDDKEFTYGYSYYVNKLLFKDGFRLVEFMDDDCNNNSKWVNPKNFITISEFRNIKIEKILV